MSRRNRRKAEGDIIGAIAVLLFLAGSAAIGYWNSLPQTDCTILGILIGLTFTSAIGLVITLVLYRKRRKAQAWHKAMASWKQSIKDGKTPNYEDANHLTPYELEKFAAQVFAKMGYRVAHTGHTGDHGVDVKLINPQGQVEIVQCKQWNKPVGEKDIRDLRGAMADEGAVRGFFWAPGGFTEPAIRWAKGKPIALADNREIGRLVESAYGE
jgi:HJR/Mrr/RecB family endonuclease